MTDLSLVQDKASALKSGAVSGSKAQNPVLGMQQQAGNKATGGMLDKKAVSAPTVTSDQATSAFTKLAPVIDVIAPTLGSSGTLDAELRIPVKGAFVGIHVTATVKRVDEKAVHLGVDANVTAGATIGVANAKFELGAYLEVQGGDASQALMITSWVLYRQLAESNAPREVEQAWFGDAKGKTAEQWDAMVRKTLFTKESGNWAEVGSQVAASATAAVGSVNAQAEAKLRMGRVYDAESIERREGAKSTTQKFASKLGVDRGAQASLGDRIFSVIGSASFSAAPLVSGGIQVTVAVRQIKDKRGGTEKTSYELDTIEVDGTASCVGMDVAASLLAGGSAVRNLLDKVTTNAASATEKAKKELQSQAREASAVAGDLDNLRDGLSTASQQLGGAGLDIPGLAASGQIHIVGGYKDHKPFLTVLFEKMTAITLDVGVFALSAVKIERLASIEYKDGKWTARLGELSKELGKPPPQPGGGKTTTAATKPGSGTGKTP